MTGSN